MASTTAEETVKVLRSLFARQGIPRQLVTDKGRQLVSEIFRHFLRSYGVRHVTSASYHLATNGLAEKFVQTFKRVLQRSPHGQLFAAL